MSEVLEPELIDRAEISAGKVLVEYTRTEAALADLRTRYAGAKFEVATVAGDKAARAARLELVTLRTGLEKRRKEFKAPALEFGKKIDAEAARITAEIEALEKPIDAQIRADEERREAERQERARIESDRVLAHRNRITAIYQCATKAQGLPSARIANGIAAVDALITDEATYQEFAREAADAKAETLATMRALFATTKAAEETAAAQEAQRLEQARVAEEQRAEAARLDQARAMIAKAEREAAEKIEADRAQFARERAEFAAAQEKAAKELEARDAQHVLKAEAPAPDATDRDAPVNTSPSVGSMGVGQPADAGATVVGTLNVGAICKRFGNGLTMTAAFIEQELGVTPATTDKAAKLFTEAQFRVICDRLMVLAGKVRSGEAVAA